MIAPACCEIDVIYALWDAPATSLGRRNVAQFSVRPRSAFTPFSGPAGSNQNGPVAAICHNILTSMDDSFPREDTSVLIPILARILRSCALSRAVEQVCTHNKIYRASFSRRPQGRVTRVSRSAFTRGGAQNTIQAK